MSSFCYARRATWCLAGILFAVVPARAQPASPSAKPSPTPPPVQITAFTHVRQRAEVSQYVGHRFRTSVRLFADTTNSDGAEISFSATGFDAGRQFVFFAAPSGPPVRTTTWQTRTCSGTIEKRTQTLAFNVVYGMNGTFGVDDLTLEVEQAKGQWQRVPLTNGDLEDAATDSVTHLSVGWREPAPTPSFTLARVAESPTNHYLQIRGRGVVHYGHNRRAGHFQMTNGVKLYYESYGQGEPLLLLHGNGESIGSFRNQIGALAEWYRVIAVDTRGHGQSTADGRRLTYDLFADDMRALLDSLRIPAAHLVGWSDGGNTGLSMAIRYPQYVKSLTTMGANLYCDPSAVTKPTISEVRLIKAFSVAMTPCSKTWRWRRRLATLLLRYPRMKPSELAAIKVPTLVLAGENDVIQPAHTQLIAASIPGAKCVIFPGLSHYAPQDNGPVFNQTVLDFLAQPAKADAGR